MDQESPRSAHATADADDASPTSVDTWLEAVSKELDPVDCEELSELGSYSIHDHDTARTITLPKDADQFETATTVKQYYFDGDDCPLLIVAPLTV